MIFISWLCLISNRKGLVCHRLGVFSKLPSLSYSLSGRHLARPSTLSCHPQSHQEEKRKGKQSQCLDRDQLVLIWINTSYPPNQVQKFVLESRHPLIEYHPLQECHQHKLAISLVTICLFHVVSFKRVAKLSDNGHALVLRAFDGNRKIWHRL